MRNIAMLLVAGCTIGMLTGCGIPEEEHNAAIAQVKADWQAEADQLKSDIADKDSIIDNEKKKVRQQIIQLDDNAERITGLQQKNAETAKALATEKSNVAKLESEVKTSKSMTASAEDRATEAEGKFSTLDVEYQELKRRFEMFQKNMRALSAPPAEAAPAAAAAPDADEPASPKTKTSSLLDEMGTL